MTTDKVKTIEDLFKETNAILRRLQTKSGEVEYSSRTCLSCCGHLYPTAESFWCHLNQHTVEQVRRILKETLQQLYHEMLKLKKEGVSAMNVKDS